MEQIWDGITERGYPPALGGAEAAANRNMLLFCVPLENLPSD